MNRPKKENPDKKTKQLRIRLSEDEYNALRFLADDYKMTMSEFIRTEVIKGYLRYS